MLRNDDYEKWFERLLNIYEQLSNEEYVEGDTDKNVIIIQTLNRSLTILTLCPN